MLLLMSESVTISLTQISIAAFTALPEVILGLSLHTVYIHIKALHSDKQLKHLTWACLFGVPTSVFFVLTVWTLTASSLQIGYELPAFAVASRVLAGYAFGLLSMMYALIGKPDEIDAKQDLICQIEHLKTEKESEIKLLTGEKESEIKLLACQIERLETEIERLETEIERHLTSVDRLSERASSLASQHLELYGSELSTALTNGAKTISIEKLSELSGHSKRKINAAKLQRHSRNKDLILCSSVLDWLRITPPNMKIIEIVEIPNN